MIGLSELALVFLKLGALGFGGPFALLALMEREVVGRRRWLSAEEFAESVAIGTLTPGPIFFAAAVHAGYRLRGLAGAVIAAVCSLLPACALATLLAALYVRVETLPAMVGAARGASAAVAGLLGTLAVRQGLGLRRDRFGLAVGAGSFLALALLKVNPALVILAAAAAGAAARPRGEARPCCGSSS
ncbi:MAG: chromate transporter [Chitinophagales bacterium]